MQTTLPGSRMIGALQHNEQKHPTGMGGGSNRTILSQVNHHQQRIQTVQRSLEDYLSTHSCYPHHLYWQVGHYNGERLR
jgi:hypothetical protein